MELKIARWTSKGLRCPDGVVDLKKNAFKRFNFIQMPNGTGKTTYLELIQAALSGSFSEQDGKTIGQYYHPTNSSDESFFELDVECNSEKVTFRIDFDFDIEACKNKSDNNKSKAIYSTELARKGGSTPGYKPPRNIRRMLTSEFVKLFVFDGEFATKLFDPGYNTAFQCLDSICQLNIFDKMEEALKIYYKNQLIEKAKTKAGVTKAVNLRDSFQTKMDKLNKQISDGEKDLKRIDKEVKNIEKEINEDTSLGGNLKKEMQDKKDVVDSLGKEYEKFCQDYFDIIRNPINLHENFVSSLNELQKNLYKLKIPASATRAFFDELKEEENCICDRKMDKEAGNAIDKNKMKYFDEDRASIYNKLKSDIRDKLNAKDFNKNILSEKNEEFQKIDEQRAEAKTDLDVAMEKVKQSAPERLAKKIARKEILMKEKEKINKEIDEIKNDTESRPEKTKSIAVLKKAISYQTDEINKIQSNIELKKDIDRIESLCTQVKADVKKNVKQKIVDQCNNKLKEIFTGRKKIKIDDIEECISLSQQSGASMGQQLTAGMIYLAILLGRENFNFFTIFDSPCGVVDLHVRSDLSESLVELIKQEGQFIAFMQSSERDQFTETIEKKVNKKDIFYLTIYDKERFSSNGMPNLPKEKSEETKNAIFVNDKVFFNNFTPSSDIKDNIAGRNS